MIINIIVLFFMINLFGCFFVASASFDSVNGNGWIKSENLQNESNLMIYITAVYWATLTCATDGYGDILPQNDYEKILTCMVLVFGVASFSYILSDLSASFSELQKESKLISDREFVIRQFEKKFKLDEHLIKQIKYFFKQHHESKLDAVVSLDMSYLLKILPQMVKAQLLMFLYREPIQNIVFLKNRIPSFYEQYLEELKPMRFEKDTVILETG